MNHAFVTVVLLTVQQECMSENQHLFLGLTLVFSSSQPFLKQGLVGLVTGFLGGLFGTIYPISAIQPLATSFIMPSFLHYITAELWISVALLTLPAQ